MPRWKAFLRQRCPRCRRGPVFDGWVEVQKKCPECGLVFERESGYFLGAMYVSYFASAAVLAILVWAFRLGLGGSLEKALALSLVIYLPLVPLFVRVSRLIWIYMDQRFDPGG